MALEHEKTKKNMQFRPKKPTRAKEARGLRGVIFVVQAGSRAWRDDSAAMGRRLVRVAAVAMAAMAASTFVLTADETPQVRQWGYCMTCFFSVDLKQVAVIGSNKTDSKHYVYMYFSVCRAFQLCVRFALSLICACRQSFTGIRSKTRMTWLSRTRLQDFGRQV